MPFYISLALHEAGPDWWDTNKQGSDEQCSKIEFFAFKTSFGMVSWVLVYYNIIDTCNNSSLL